MVHKIFKNLVSKFKRRCIYRVDQKVVPISTGSTVIRTRLTNSKYDRIVHVANPGLVRVQSVKQRFKCKAYREREFGC